MSRGPGRIERAIRQLFDGNLDLAFVTDEVAEHCYPNAQPTRSTGSRCCGRRGWW
jgi:hypothetical protein